MKPETEEGERLFTPKPCPSFILQLKMNISSSLQEWQIHATLVHVARILNVLIIIIVLCVHVCPVILAIQERIVSEENVKVRKIV